MILCVITEEVVHEGGDEMKFSKIAHLAVLASELVVLFAIVAYYVVYQLPVAKRSHFSSATQFTFRLDKARDCDLSRLKAFRVDYTTIAKPERDRHGDQMIRIPVTASNVFDEHQVMLPEGTLIVGVSFHFEDGKVFQHEPPPLAEFRIGSQSIDCSRLENYRNWAYNFPAWYYEPKPTFNGYSLHVLTLGCVIWILVFVSGLFVCKSQGTVQHK